MAEANATGKQKNEIGGKPVDDVLLLITRNTHILAQSGGARLFLVCGLGFGSSLAPDAPFAGARRLLAPLTTRVRLPRAVALDEVTPHFFPVAAPRPVAVAEPACSLRRAR